MNVPLGTNVDVTDPEPILARTEWKNYLIFQSKFDKTLQLKWTHIPVAKNSLILRCGLDVYITRIACFQYVQYLNPLIGTSRFIICMLIHLLVNWENSKVICTYLSEPKETSIIRGKLEIRIQWKNIGLDQNMEQGTEGDCPPEPSFPTALSLLLTSIVAVKLFY